MSLMDRIKSMDPKEVARRPEVKAVWDRGLLWALAHRRSYKYPLGAAIPESPDHPEHAFFGYTDLKEPVPLDEVELALLCWAAAGTNGLIRNDLSFTQDACTHPWFEGRVYPSACNVWYAHLIFSHDDGIFLYRPHAPTRIVEVETEDDLEVIFRAFKEGVVQLSDQPVRQAPDTGIHRSYTFQPGTTTFFPIADTTVEALNLYILGCEPEERKRFFDDEAGRPAGIERWIESGYLSGPLFPMSRYEIMRGQSLFGHALYMQQNLQLCAAALGLGGFVYAGALPNLLLLGETLGKAGVKMQLARDKRGFEYPVGIDEVIETHAPPYMTLDEAVEDIWNMKFGPGYGRYNAEVKEGEARMYRGFDPNPRAIHRPFTDSERYCTAARVQTREAVEIAKAIANYIYETYGRFPRYFDPIVCHLEVQISHIDIGFYERYQLPGAIWQEQREHLRAWHS